MITKVPCILDLLPAGTVSAHGLLYQQALTHTADLQQANSEYKILIKASNGISGTIRSTVQINQN
jgi:hypothetical protein